MSKWILIYHVLVSQQYSIQKRKKHNWYGHGKQIRPQFSFNTFPPFEEKLSTKCKEVTNNSKWTKHLGKLYKLRHTAS